MSERPRRARAVPPDVAAGTAQPARTTSDAELVDRLVEALATLPPSERAAAVVAIGMDEGAAGVARDQDLDEPDAEALTRNAVQLLRGALADVELDEREVFARLARRPRRGRGTAPDS